MFIYTVIDGQKQPARLSMINQRKPEAVDSRIYTHEPSVGELNPTVKHICLILTSM